LDEPLESLMKITGAPKEQAVSFNAAYLSGKRTELSIQAFFACVNLCVAA